MTNRRPWLLAAVVVAIALLLIWLVRSSAEPVAPPPATPKPAGAAPVAAVGSGAAVLPEAGVDVRERVDHTPSAPPPAPAAKLWRGRVLDSRGRPLADVPVGLVAFDYASRQLTRPSATVPSDAQGAFAVPGVDGVAVPVAGDGFCTLRTTPRLAPADDDDLLLVAAPAVHLRGHVAAADGQALPAVLLQATAMFLSEFPLPLERTFQPDLAIAHTDERGDYELAAVPVAAGLDLLFSKQGFTARRVPSEQAAGGRLDVTLQTASGKAGRIHGVVRAGAVPVAAAKLLLGFDQETTSSATGEFSFEFPKRPSRLLATARGYQPVVREQVGEATPEVVVEFTQRALQIEGLVQQADGAPAVGWRLDLVDPMRGSGYRAVEGACSDLPPVEDALAVTGPDGRFVLGGLAARTYQLLAYDPKTLLAVKSEPIAAGTTGVVLRVPADAVVPELRGIVVDRAGVPVAGAMLSVYLLAASLEGVASGPVTAAGPDGRFVLRGVPRGLVQLGVVVEGYRYDSRPIEEWLRLADLRIVVLRMCHVQIEGEEGLQVSFVEADGKRLHVEMHSQAAGFSSDAWTLRGGRSPVLSLPESTATMVWSRDGKELGRKSIFLDPKPGAVTPLVAAR